MATITLIITDAGLAEVINAQQNGTAPTQITQVGFGTGKYTATHEQTALQEEFKRLSTIAGGAISPNQIHVTARDGVTQNAYSVFEIGVYLESGTLFAVYSLTTPIIEKAAESSMMLAIDIELTGSLTPEMIEFGDTNFQLNSATEQHEGLVQLATVAEAKAGTDSTKAVTPEGVKAAIDEIPDVDLSGYAKQGNIPTVFAPVEGAGIYSAGGGRALEFGGVAGMSGHEPLRLVISTTTNPSTKRSLELYRAIGTDGWTEHDTWTSDGQRPQATTQQAQTGAGGWNGTVMSAHNVKVAINAQRPFATQGQAENGTDNVAMMTPLRTKEAIDKWRPFATKAEAEGGTNTPAMMTPLRTKEAIDAQRPIFVKEFGRIGGRTYRWFSNSEYEIFGRIMLTYLPGEMSAQITLPHTLAGPYNVLVTPMYNPEGRVVLSANVSGDKYLNITLSEPLVSGANEGPLLSWLVTGSRFD